MAEKAATDLPSITPVYWSDSKYRDIRDVDLRERIENQCRKIIYLDPLTGTFLYSETIFDVLLTDGGVVWCEIDKSVHTDAPKMLQTASSSTDKNPSIDIFSLYPNSKYVMLHGDFLEEESLHAKIRLAYGEPNIKKILYETKKMWCVQKLDEIQRQKLQKENSQTQDGNLLMPPRATRSRSRETSPQSSPQSRETSPHVQLQLKTSPQSGEISIPRLQLETSPRSQPETSPRTRLLMEGFPQSHLETPPQLGETSPQSLESSPRSPENSPRSKLETFLQVGEFRSPQSTRRGYKYVRARDQSAIEQFSILPPPTKGPKHYTASIGEGSNPPFEKKFSSRMKLPPITPPAGLPEVVLSVEVPPPLPKISSSKPTDETSDDDDENTSVAIAKPPNWKSSKAWRTEQSASAPTQKSSDHDEETIRRLKDLGFL